MKHTYIIVLCALVGCQPKENVQPSTVPTTPARTVDTSFYRFLSGRWVYCQNPTTWVVFTNDTSIVNFAGTKPDTSTYKIILASKSNWLQMWRTRDSAYTWMQIEWRQDNTLFIGGGQYCRP